MSLLAIDAGNTRVKWARDEAGTWVDTGAMATRALLEGTAPPGPGGNVDALIICNVAGAEAARRLLDWASASGVPAQLAASRARACGVFNGYRDPAQLGTDRWAALIGAHGNPRYGRGAKLVVLAGTALTVDVLHGDGVFAGGIIAPGPELMRTALNRGTAQLPLTAGEPVDFPAGTAEAIDTGVIDACAGAIGRVGERLRAHSGVWPFVVACGGAAAAIVRALPFEATINDNLVFDGLRALACAGD
ncbi:MAG TPA: type III pantothenate kinase [Usitatibacteraceae bacterium]|nr:type III pantothenate kinase [Usitatibacteraceae bacterium]